MLKTQILPYDNVDFERVLDALKTRGFLVQYHDTGGGKYGWIPTFKDHQFINNKEKPSTLPDPKKCSMEEDMTREPRDGDAMATRGVKDIGKDIDIDKKEKENTLRDSNESTHLSLKRWFDEVMWPSVPKKVGKDLTWEKIKNLKPDERAKAQIVDYFTRYPKIKAEYDEAGIFYAEMQDPVRVIKNRRYLDVLSPPDTASNGGANVPKDNSWTEYCDIKAYRKAKAEGKKNITLSWELRHKYPEEV